MIYSREKVETSFSHCKHMGFFLFTRSRAANFAVGCRIWLNFELVRDFMHFLVNCKYEKGLDEILPSKKWRHRFPHYNPMEAICCHGNQSSASICTKTQCCLLPNPMMLQIKFNCNWPTCLRDIDVCKCGHTDARTEGHRLDTHPIRALCEP